MPASVDPQWYRKIWSLDIQDMSWVEHTTAEVEFIVQSLDLRPGARILDLACGFGRHALQFARRGHPVTGVDLTPAYIDAARRQAAAEGLAQAEFICADLRQVHFQAEFDAVLNLADGAIGYLEDDAENLKIFDLVAAALKPGGKHFMGVCNRSYAEKHFPRRHWQAGSRALSLADFTWDAAYARMLYTGYTFRYGEPLPPVPEQAVAASSTRLYSLSELRQILAVRRLTLLQAYSTYDAASTASEDQLEMLVVSVIGSLTPPSPPG